MTPLLTIRSTPARVGAWAWMAFAALNLVDIAWRGRDAASLVMASLLLFGCGLAYVVGLRPAVVAHEAGLTIRNPLRDARLPWRAAKTIEGRDALTFWFEAADGGERKIKAWVLQTSPRAQAKAQRQAAKDFRRSGIPQVTADKLKDRTPVTYAAERLNEIADRHRPKAPKEEGVIGWSRKALAALAVPAVLVVAASVIALVA